MAYKVHFIPILAALPRDKFIELEMDRAIKDEGIIVQREFNKFFETWQNRPGIMTNITTSQNWIWNLFVHPVGEEDVMDRVKWVVRGTKPHPIEPRYVGFGSEWYPLRYKGTFTAKTIPGVIQSRPGGKTGRWVTKDRVRHPGIEPRNVDWVLEGMRAPLFAKSLRKNFQRGVNKMMQDVYRRGGK